MKNAIILHGMTGKDDYYATDSKAMSNSHSNWLPWLQQQLIARDILAVTPEVPHNYSPDYSVWKREFERFEISPETILVGHSCGAGFIVRWLSENRNVFVGKVVLVAPWLDPERESTGDYFEFEIDTKLVSRTKGVVIFHSNNDPVRGVLASVDLLLSKLKGVESKLCPEYGHFCFEKEQMETKEFSELLEVILN